MISTPIVGAAGYIGQETLDRVLRHPQLELVALGSDTFAGRPASALEPRLARLDGALPELCYIRGIPVEAARERLLVAYAQAPAVTVLPEGVAPEIGRVHRTDAAEIGVFADSVTGTTIVICAEENLGKGAAGQAVQNANLALGLPETDGLLLGSVSV